jgi:hypothetical protein
MIFGKPGAAPADRRRKIGSMPQNNCDPARKPAKRASPDSRCPKCGVEMEPIEVEIEELPVQELELCPNCYLVTWTDQDGPHARQGVPVKPGVNLHSSPAPGEPEEC